MTRRRQHRIRARGRHSDLSGATPLLCTLASVLFGKGISLGAPALIAVLAVTAGVAYQGPPSAAVAAAQPGAAKAKKKKKGKKRRVIASDTGATDSPLGFWSAIECADASRQELLSGGGDPHRKANGVPQGNDSFRRLRVLDGDDWWGERCELGENDRDSSTTFYHPDRRRITSFSVRLPSGFQLGVYTWQAIMQMKQTAPAANSGGTPVLELDAYGGRWRLRQSLSTGPAEDSRELWSAPARMDTWTRFSLDIRYSPNSQTGFIVVKADINGDLDYRDPGERSRKMRTYTLKVETEGDDGDGISQGQAIPSHLRAGIYHDSDIHCPPPVGCPVDIDNIQIVRP